jgi:hypothetical protein
MATQVVRFSSLISRDVFQSGSLTDQARVDLKSYFVAVKTRFESGEEFPYDIEELVPVVFTRRDMAMEALKRDFTQDIDYRLIRQKTEDANSVTGFRVANNCLLSPLAFEFMVARKNKDVFSLYHTIFHLKTVPSVATGPVDLDLMIQQNAMIGKAIIELKSQREAMQAIQQDVADIKAALPSPKTHTTIRAYSAVRNIKMDARTAQRLGRRASHLSVQMGRSINHIPDDLYGTVNAYPNDIIERVFNDHFCANREAA